jgi:hypothetical protein
MSLREIRDLMKRSHNRPLEPVPPLHVMGLRRQADDKATTTERSEQ